MKAIVVTICLVVLMIGLSKPIDAAEKLSALKAAELIAGTYTGHWDMYGLDKNGEVVLTRSWDDEIKLENPRIGVDPFVKEQRAFGDVTTKIITRFPTGVAPMIIRFTEGFKIQSDGSAGERYFAQEFRGRIVETIETRSGENVWTYESPVNLLEYASLGLNAENILFAKAFTVKAVTAANGLEIESISQTTTLVWKPKDGVVRSKQFASMVGFHSRPLSH